VIFGRNFFSKFVSGPCPCLIWRRFDLTHNNLRIFAHCILIVVQLEYSAQKGDCRLLAEERLAVPTLSLKSAFGGLQLFCRW